MMTRTQARAMVENPVTSDQAVQLSILCAIEELIALYNTTVSPSEMAMQSDEVYIEAKEAEVKPKRTRKKKED